MTFSARLLICHFESTFKSKYKKKRARNIKLA